MDTQHDVSRRQGMLALTKRLARPAPNEIAADSPTHGALRDDQPKSGQTRVVW